MRRVGRTGVDAGPVFGDNRGRIVEVDDSGLPLLHALTQGEF